MRNFTILSLLISMLLLMTSCYEKEEGCLDFRANNYDFGADKTCDECCTYPEMKLKVSHYWGDTTLFYDSIYTGFMNQKIRMVDAQFFISDFSLTKGSEKETVIELLDIEDINGNISEIPDNTILVQSSRFTYVIGTFDQPDTYDGISFKIGIDGKYNSAETVDYPTFFNETNFEYTNFRMRYVLEHISSDTILFELTGPELVLALEIDANFIIPQGENFTLPLYADYDKLLDNIDLSKPTSIATQNQFISNLIGFLSF